MPTLLRDLTIEEISSVDKGANPGARVLLTKRHAKEGDQSMPSSTIVIKNAEAVVAYGIPPAFPKSYYIGEIQKRASEIRAAGDSDAKAFTKAITDDTIGRTLFKASKSASGPEIEPDEVQDDVKPTQFSDYGPAHAELEMHARDHLLRHPNKTIEQARSAAYSAPANADLRRQVMAEHFDRITSGSAPRTDAQRVEQEHKAPRELQQDAVDDQMASNAFADRQACAFGGRDVKGPRGPKGSGRRSADDLDERATVSNDVGKRIRTASDIYERAKALGVYG